MRKAVAVLPSLKKRVEFLHIQGSGKKWVSTGMIVQALPNGTDACRYGLTVSKKVNKRAVVRNRIRRRLRAAAREVVGQYAAPGTDFVLIGRQISETRPYADLCRDLKWCIEKMGFGKDKPKGGAPDQAVSL